MKKMRKEYENIEIPKELKGRVEQAIQQAKEDNQKERFKKGIPKNIGYGAVAAMLAITILTNTNEQIAYAMAEMPVLGAISKVVTFRNYVHKDGTMEADIKTPKVEGDSDSVQNLNEQMEAYTNTIKENYEKDLEHMMEQDGIEAQTNKEAVSTNYDVVCDNARILSIKIQTTVVMADSNVYSKCYTLDKKTGEILELKDLFKEGADYKTIISEDIIRQMEQQMAEDDEKSYFIHTEGVGEGFDFEQIKDDQNFFLDEKNQLNIVFDKYEVAPGYMGERVFTIDKQVVSDLLKEDSVLK